MAIQDDKRESQMVDRFNLTQPEDRRRDETDAYLEIDGLSIPFELKSTSKTSFGTVRDFGEHYRDKWSREHWLFAVYNEAGDKLQYCYYASPADMLPWIDGRLNYIRPDLLLADEAASSIGLETLGQVLGIKDSYTYKDARSIMKNQWNRERYDAEKDITGGYSQARMIAILRERCKYVMARGATLNNPHIPLSYFAGWDKILSDPAASLRTKVRAYLAAVSAEPTDDAT